MNSCNKDEDGWLEYKVVSNFSDNAIRDTICKEYCISNLLELPVSEINKIIMTYIIKNVEAFDN